MSDAGAACEANWADDLPGPTISAVTSVMSSSFMVTTIPSSGSFVSLRSSLATFMMTPGEMFSFT